MFGSAQRIMPSLFVSALLASMALAQLDGMQDERAWLACARRVMSQLRFLVKDAPSEVRLTLIWMRDDVPHGTGLL